MSESAKTPMPGSASALRQRREGYAIAERAPSTIDDARAMMDIGMDRQAANKLNALMDSVAANPLASRLLEERQPGFAQGLARLHGIAAAAGAVESRKQGIAAAAAVAQSRKQEAAPDKSDIWGSRERAGQAARAEAPQQAQRTGQSMGTGG